VIDLITHPDVGIHGSWIVRTHASSEGHIHLDQLSYYILFCNYLDALGSHGVHENMNRVRNDDGYGSCFDGGHWHVCGSEIALEK